MCNRGSAGIAFSVKEKHTILETNCLEYNTFCSLVLLKNAVLASLQHDTPKQEYSLLLHLRLVGLHGGGRDILSYG